MGILKEMLEKMAEKSWIPSSGVKKGPTRFDRTGEIFSKMVQPNERIRPGMGQINAPENRRASFTPQNLADIGRPIQSFDDAAFASVGQSIPPTTVNAARAKPVPAASPAPQGVNPATVPSAVKPTATATVPQQAVAPAPKTAPAPQQATAPAPKPASKPAATVQARPRVRARPEVQAENLPLPAAVANRPSLRDVVSRQATTQPVVRPNQQVVQRPMTSAMNSGVVGDLTHLTGNKPQTISPYGQVQYGTGNGQYLTGQAMGSSRMNAGRVNPMGGIPTTAVSRPPIVNMPQTRSALGVQGLQAPQMGALQQFGARLNAAPPAPVASSAGPLAQGVRKVVTRGRA